VASVHLAVIVQAMSTDAALLAFGLSSAATGFEGGAQVGPPASFESVFDKDSKRYTLTAVERGKVTIQVTGEQVDLISAIAKLRCRSSG